MVEMKLKFKKKLNGRQEKFSYFESLDSPPCVEEDFGLKMRSGQLAGERYKAKREVVLTF